MEREKVLNDKQRELEEREWALLARERASFACEVRANSMEIVSSEPSMLHSMDESVFDSHEESGVASMEAMETVSNGDVMEISRNTNSYEELGAASMEAMKAVSSGEVMKAFGKHNLDVTEDNYYDFVKSLEVPANYNKLVMFIKLSKLCLELKIFALNLFRKSCTMT